MTTASAPITSNHYINYDVTVHVAPATAPVIPASPPIMVTRPIPIRFSQRSLYAEKIYNHDPVCSRGCRNAQITIVALLAIAGVSTLFTGADKGDPSLVQKGGYVLCAGALMTLVMLCFWRCGCYNRW